MNPLAPSGAEVPCRQRRTQQKRPQSNKCRTASKSSGPHPAGAPLLPSGYLTRCVIFTRHFCGASGRHICRVALWSRRKQRRLAKLRSPAHTPTAALCPGGPARIVAPRPLTGSLMRRPDGSRWGGGRCYRALGAQLGRSEARPAATTLLFEARSFTPKPPHLNCREGAGAWPLPLAPACDLPTKLIAGAALLALALWAPAGCGFAGCRPALSPTWLVGCALWLSSGCQGAGSRASAEGWPPPIKGWLGHQRTWRVNRRAWWIHTHSHSPLLVLWARGAEAPTHPTTCEERVAGCRS